LSSCLNQFFFFLFSFQISLIHSFPTRRSSDLWAITSSNLPDICRPVLSSTVPSSLEPISFSSPFSPPLRRAMVFANSSRTWFRRSEEHTSELQSRENLVCRLLLEKKK